MNKNIDVFYEATPNPQSMKFYFTESFTDESVSFNNYEEAKRSPLAQKIFGFPWTAGIHIGPNFVTVTKQDWVEWKILADPLSDLIKEHLQSGQSLLFPDEQMEIPIQQSSNDPIVKNILHILNTEIRPAVAMDGGDIQFESYHNGVLNVRLLGACSGCPSSMITLKEGVEVRLKELIPELNEVRAI
ncbi:MAG: NifU family protein [Bdellovibrionales bacterium]|nr:NifU family protein [Bdellovibrionales bacterium]